MSNSIIIVLVCAAMISFVCLSDVIVDTILKYRYGLVLTRKDVKKHLLAVLWPIGMIVILFWYVKKVIEALKND